MSTQTQERMGTSPVVEHEWLKNLVGEWQIETEMAMPDGTMRDAHGTQRVKSVGDLWAFGEGKSTMSDGQLMTYYLGLGYDVSFEEYRGFVIRSVSSHLWNYTGRLSPDGKTMTLDCMGPSMTKDGGTALYRDFIEIIDDNHHTYTATGQDENGEWRVYMKSLYARI